MSKRSGLLAGSFSHAGFACRFYYRVEDGGVDGFRMGLVLERTWASLYTMCTIKRGREL